ncbi:MAG: hypothetical protein CMJ62_06305 [Planctomycetaceae bacterium]|nr:hypothetical protein [Planctomycetaceae bacterium]
MSIAERTATGPSYQTLTVKSEPASASDSFSEPSLLTNERAGLFRVKNIMLVGIAAAVIVGSVMGRRALRSRRVSTENLVFHTVSRGDLDITVVEQGSLESQKNLRILCEVDDVRRDGTQGTPLIWLVENGAHVKEGDLIAELNSAPIQEMFDSQIQEAEQARERSMLTQAAYNNQITQNQTDHAKAKLRVKLTELKLQMFVDENNGTHKLEVEAIKRKIDDLNNDILAAQASLELKLNDKKGIETLFHLGYAGKSELDRSKLEFLQAESEYAAKINRLRTNLSRLTKKETYEKEMELLSLDGDMQTASRALEQVVRDNEAKLSQAKTSLDSSQELLKREEEVLERYEGLISKCKIYAPQDGMVTYASSREEPIRPGAPIRLRQHILSLPDLTTMQVKTSVHESLLDQVRPEMEASIRVDAFSDELYTGSVKQVAVLPDQGNWFDTETKVYETTVVIDEKVENLKPGMTAVVEIQVESLPNVLTVPVQAVVSRGSERWCYVAAHGGGVDRRETELGPTNDRYVQVTKGIQEGDRVVLNPNSLADQEPVHKEQTKEKNEPKAKSKELAAKKSG